LPVTLRRTIRGMGWVTLGFGTLVLLFVAYQLWGTGLYTRLHQERLRAQFDRELAGQRGAAKVSPGSTSPTTVPAVDGVVQPSAAFVPAEGQPIGTIDIPKISADYVVVQGTSTADLQLGPGHYLGTPLPGQPGNAAIAGHRTTYLAPFYNLDQLEPGDQIYVTTVQGRFEYVVSQTLVVSPSDTSVLDQTSTPELTLTTCNPRYSASQRLVVQAVLRSPSALPTTPSPSQVKSGAARVGPATIESPNAAAPWGAAGWGAAMIGAAIGLWLLMKRRREPLLRWGIGIFGIAGFLVLLFFFFGSVSDLLPAGF
jgi:sortase A